VKLSTEHEATEYKRITHNFSAIFLLKKNMKKIMGKNPETKLRVISKGF
jgi:hypothetical protein